MAWLLLLLTDQLMKEQTVPLQHVIMRVTTLPSQSAAWHHLLLMELFSDL